VALILSTGDIEACLTTLKERGVTVTRGPMEEFTGRSAEILDPDGYRIVVFEPSELHPDEEYVPMSEVDEKVKEKVAAWRARERAKAPAAKKPASAKKPVAKKPVAKKPVAKKPAAKKTTPKKAAPKKAAPRKPAPKKAAPRKPAPKKPKK
jgi:hypothetical protein